VLRSVASGVGLSFAVRPMGRSLLRGVASRVGLLWVVVVAGLTGGGGFIDLRKNKILCWVIKKFLCWWF
jgi:hypothetical protein